MDAALDPAAAGMDRQTSAASSAAVPRSTLVLVVHQMEQATAKVPFSMILLMDHVRTKRSMPEDSRCRMVIPSDGLISISLWDTTNPEALKQWLDDSLGSDCISQVAEVQEEFTFGVALELARARGADRVAGGSKKTLDALSAGLSTAQTRIQEWDRQTGVISTARETTASTVAKISGAVSKAAESERVQQVVAGASVAMAQGWKKVSDSLGWAGRKIEQNIVGHDDGGDAAAAFPLPGAGTGGGGAAAGAHAGGVSGNPARPSASSVDDLLDGLDSLALGMHHNAAQPAAGTGAPPPPTHQQ